MEGRAEESEEDSWSEDGTSQTATPIGIAQEPLYDDWEKECDALTSEESDQEEGGGAPAEQPVGPATTIEISNKPSPLLRPTTKVPSSRLKPAAAVAAAAAVVPESDSFYFYQAQDGQLAFLHPLNMRMLFREFGVQSSFPDVIHAPVLDIEPHVQTEAFRDRFRFLSHLPLGAELRWVFLDLSSVLSKRTIRAFQPILESRRARMEAVAAAAAEKQQKSTPTPTPTASGSKEPTSEVAASMAPTSASSVVNVEVASSPLTPEELAMIQAAIREADRGGGGGGGGGASSSKQQQQRKERESPLSPSQFPTLAEAVARLSTSEVSTTGESVAPLGHSRPSSSSSSSSFGSSKKGKKGQVQSYANATAWSGFRGEPLFVPPPAASAAQPSPWGGKNSFADALKKSATETEAERRAAVAEAELASKSRAPGTSSPQKKEKDGAKSKSKGVLLFSNSSQRNF